MNALFVWGMIAFFIWVFYVAFNRKLKNNGSSGGQTSKKQQKPKISKNPRDIDKF